MRGAVCCRRVFRERATGQRDRLRPGPACCSPARMGMPPLRRAAFGQRRRISLKCDAPGRQPNCTDRHRPPTTACEWFVSGQLARVRVYTGGADGHKEIGEENKKANTEGIVGCRREEKEKKTQLAQPLAARNTRIRAQMGSYCVDESDGIALL